MSNDMSIRTLEPIQLKPGVKLAAVVQAIEPFLVRHLDDYAVDELKESDFSESLLEIDEFSIEVHQGKLTFYIPCTGPGGGTPPSGPYEEALEGLRPHICEDAFIEVIDHDISAANDCAVVVHVLTPVDRDYTDEQAIVACAAARIRKVAQAIAPENVLELVALDPLGPGSKQTKPHAGNISTIKVGDTLWFVPYDKRYWLGEVELTVTSVGRKYLGLRWGSSKTMRCHKDTLDVQAADGNQPGRCYMSKAGYEEQRAQRDKWAKFQKLVARELSRPDSLPESAVDLLLERMSASNR